jgi:hypothetical protein
MSPAPPLGWGGRWSPLDGTLERYGVETTPLPTLFFPTEYMGDHKRPASASSRWEKDP